MTIKALLAKGRGSVTPSPQVMVNYLDKQGPHLTAHYSRTWMLNPTTAAAGSRICCRESPQVIHQTPNDSFLMHSLTWVLIESEKSKNPCQVLHLLYWQRTRWYRKAEMPFPPRLSYSWCDLSERRVTLRWQGFQNSQRRRLSDVQVGLAEKIPEEFHRNRTWNILTALISGFLSPHQGVPTMITRLHFLPMMRPLVAMTTCNFLKLCNDDMIVMTQISPKLPIMRLKHSTTFFFLPVP